MYHGESDQPPDGQWIFVPTIESHNHYSISADDARPKTVARALLDLFFALLGFGFRLFVRIMTIAFIIAVYAAMFFVFLLFFAVLFSLG
ncbi:MAG: hypothetical protein M1415_07285 [Firmicutes bacterium]|nr:hypothetical protein [Bacillota bacterium]MCL5064037.1 hypothetical protein [Bacillota bacterium]